MRQLSLFLTLLLLYSTVRGQQFAPDAFAYPIRNVEGLYAANFGEIRPGHFHAGIDIKTDGVEGKPLVATADGYVSRITITAGGYGRALYLTLHNGTTAVYGHLQCFRDDLERHVDAERRKRRSNDIDLFFGPDTWPVQQGEEIGFSGNSGSSSGPHLHYEIRETATHRRINIVRAGIIRPHDDLPPRILQIHYVEVDSTGGVCVQASLDSYAVVRTAAGHYRLTRNEPIEVGRRGYFVAEVSDRRNDVHNRFGVWRVTMAIDEIPHFEYRMEGFTPDLSRSRHAVSYYADQLRSRNETIRLACLSESPAGFYPTARERGLVRTEAGQTRRIHLEVEDDMGNLSTLEFDIRGRKGVFRATTDPAAVVLRPDRSATIGFGTEISAHFPVGSLYEALFCKPERLEIPPQAPAGIVLLSPLYRILDTSIPLRQAAHIAIRTEVPRPLQFRSALARLTDKGRLAYIGGNYTDGHVQARTRSTGPLLVVADTLPPRISPLFAEEAPLPEGRALRFHAEDNFSGIVAWELLIDGEWVPCDRFPMRGTLVHTPRIPRDGRHHTVRLTVTDACGNTARLETSFIR